MADMGWLSSDSVGGGSTIFDARHVDLLYVEPNE